MNKQQQALETVLQSKDEAFLVQAYGQIVRRVKSLRSIKSLEAIGFFKKGDAVQWNNKGIMRKGTVVDIRTKKVEVSVDDGQDISGRWIVPASMLKKI